MVKIFPVIVIVLFSMWNLSGCEPESTEDALTEITFTLSTPTDVADVVTLFDGIDDGSHVVTSSENYLVVLATDLAMAHFSELPEFLEYSTTLVTSPSPSKTDPSQAIQKTGEVGAQDQASHASSSYHFNVASSNRAWQQSIRTGIAGKLNGITVFSESTGSFDMRIRVGGAWSVAPSLFSTTVFLDGSGSMFVDMRAADIVFDVGDVFVMEVEGNGSGVWLQGSGSSSYSEQLCYRSGSLIMCPYTNGTQDLGFVTYVDDATCPGDDALGSGSYCSEECPCSEGEGDCDGTTEQCEPGLTCVHNVGANYGWDAGVDVCEATCHTSALGSGSYCSEECPCSEGEGDCDGTTEQCEPGLTCVHNVGANYGWDAGVDVCE